MSTTMTRVTAVPLDVSFAPATAGQQLLTSPTGAITTVASGDLIPISSGRGTLIMIQTTGTATVVTLVNQVAPPYGGAASVGNITVTMGTTDFQVVFISNDGADRFDPGVGQVNAGFITLNYSVVTGVVVRAITIP